RQPASREGQGPSHNRERRWWRCAASPRATPARPAAATATADTSRTAGCGRSPTGRPCGCTSATQSTPPAAPAASTFAPQGVVPRRLGRVLLHRAAQGHRGQAVDVAAGEGDDARPGELLADQAGQPAVDSPGPRLLAGGAELGPGQVD